MGMGTSNMLRALNSFAVLIWCTKQGPWFCSWTEVVLVVFLGERRGCWCQVVGWCHGLVELSASGAFRFWSNWSGCCSVLYLLSFLLYEEALCIVLPPCVYLVLKLEVINIFCCFKKIIAVCGWQHWIPAIIALVVNRIIIEEYQVGWWTHSLLLK
jgi:hypothetical protein